MLVFRGVASLQRPRQVSFIVRLCVERRPVVSSPTEAGAASGHVKTASPRRTGCGTRRPYRVTAGWPRPPSTGLSGRRSCGSGCHGRSGKWGFAYFNGA